ncbi:MAG: Slp family lipoprotein [Desulfurella sp.]|jgi:outer membrane lipoprotein
MSKGIFKKLASLITVVVSFAMLNSCATILPISGNYAQITPIEAQTGKFFGKTVRFGGTIISTIPQQNNQTCFVVLGLKLHSNGKPYKKEPKNFVGRFLACAHGYYDPEIYQKGKKITFVGTIVGIEKEKVGNYTYSYPVLDVKSLYLWPKNTEYENCFPYNCPTYSLAPWPYFY